MLSQSMKSPRGTRTAPHIMPAGGSELCCVEALPQERAHHLISECLHAAVRVMDHEPLVRAKQLVGDNKRADASSLARPPALRITCASPSARPANLAGSSRASMQVRMAKRRA